MKLKEFWDDNLYHKQLSEIRGTNNIFLGKHKKCLKVINKYLRTSIERTAIIVKKKLHLNLFLVPPWFKEGKTFDTNGQPKAFLVALLSSLLEG